MKDIDLKISANSAEHIHHTGTFVHVKSANEPVKFRFDGNNVTLNAGQSFRVNKPFTSLEVENETSNAVTAVVVVGTGKFSDTEISGNVTINGSETLDTVADVTLLATATTQIATANTSRNEIIISNLAANTQNFRIGDSDTGAARGMELQPGEKVTLSTSAAVYGYNPGASAESVAVLEVLN